VPKGPPNGGHDSRSAASEAAERARRADGARPRDIAADDLDTWSGDTRGVTRGHERPDKLGPQQVGGEREGIDAAAVASFTKELAEMASADPEDPAAAMSEEQQQDEALEGLEQTEAVVTSARPARKETVEPGGDDEPVEEPGTPPAPDAPAAAAPSPNPIPKIRARARVAWLGLEEVLEYGEAAGLLTGWPKEQALARIPKLPTIDWVGLVDAFRVCPTRFAAVLVLKALAAHRLGRTLPAFAEQLLALGDGEAARRLDERGPPPPDEPTARQLRLRHDPIAALADTALPPEVQADATWSVPRWLRGVPRLPVDFALVAVDMALTNDLRPGATTDQGASDALTAALAPSGAAHPSLERWLITLCARAESRADLATMREALLSARSEMTV